MAVKIEKTWVVDAAKLPGDVWWNAPRVNHKIYYLTNTPESKIEQTKDALGNITYTKTEESYGSLVKIHNQVNISEAEFNLLKDSPRCVSFISFDTFDCEGYEIKRYGDMFLVTAVKRFKTMAEVLGHQPVWWLDKEVTEDRRYKDGVLAIPRWY